MGSLGFDELLIVIFVAIIVFGKDLPSVARKVGGWYSKLRRQMTDLRDEIQRQIPDEDLDEPVPPPPSGTTPSANLPGPEPGDPEYRGQDALKPAGESKAPAVSEPAAAGESKPFDPARPAQAPDGNGAAQTGSSPAPTDSTTKPPESPAS